MRGRDVEEKPEDEDFAAFYEQARSDGLRAVYAAVGDSRALAALRAALAPTARQEPVK